MVWRAPVQLLEDLGPAKARSFFWQNFNRNDVAGGRLHALVHAAKRPHAQAGASNVVLVNVVFPTKLKERGTIAACDGTRRLSFCRLSSKGANDQGPPSWAL